MQVIRTSHRIDAIYTCCDRINEHLMQKRNPPLFRTAPKRVGSLGLINLLVRSFMPVYTI